MIKVTQADRDFADAIAEEGPRLLRGIFRQELAEGVAMYRISALTTAQAQAAAQEQRIAELEAALEAMLYQRDRDIQAGRMQFSDPAPANAARAILERQADT